MVFFDLCIVACRNSIKSQRDSFIQKNVKFYLTVAKYIWIWCKPIFVTFYDISDNAVVIFLLIIKYIELNSKIIGYFLCFRKIFFGCAGFIFCCIVYHKTSGYIKTLLHQK